MKLPEGLTQVVPMLAYEDVGAAMDWLVTAFGFREQTAWPMRPGATAISRWVTA